MTRFLNEHIEAWHHHGGILIPNFFSTAEIAAVKQDFENVFGRSQGAEQPLIKHQPGQPPSFHDSQFKTFEAIPFINAPALNLIGVHPQLIAFAKQALASEQVYLYQCQAWAKFTGDADYEQPFHCDFVNHTLTVPSEVNTQNSVTILCYFTDVTEAHGPMHFVSRQDSQKIAGPEASLNPNPELQTALANYEQSSAASAGSIFPYAIDVYHRGTNMTIPHGVRYAVMACFKAAGNDAVGYHAWQFHQTKPWHELFATATPEQLACFGVATPGDPFWTNTTLARAQIRYPTWDLSPYRRALASKLNE